MKAFLVVDIPDDLMAEECDVDYQVYYSNENADSFLVEESTAMTLKPLPEKKETCSVIDYASGKAMIDEYENEFNLGFNACLKEITGDCDEE